MKFEEPLTIMENAETPAQVVLYITGGIYAEATVSSKTIRMPAMGFATDYDEIWDIMWENLPKDVLPSEATFMALQQLYKFVLKDHLPNGFDTRLFPEYRSLDIKTIMAWPEEVQLAFGILGMIEMEDPNMCGAWSGTVIGENEMPIVCARIPGHEDPHILTVGPQPVAVWDRKEGEIYFDLYDIEAMQDKE